MKNINWSKWIAIALSIFIVTQFVQVSFLAARRFGGNAGGNATEASGVAGIYEGLLGAVGEDNGLVMSARAAETVSITGPDTSGIAIDMSGFTAEDTASIDFAISASAGIGEGDLLTCKEITFPAGVSLTDASVNVENTEGKNVTVVGSKVDNTVSISFSTTVTDADLSAEATVTVSGIKLGASANLPAADATDDSQTITGPSDVTFTCGSIKLPRQSSGSTEPTSSGSTPETVTVSAALTKVDGVTYTSGPIDLSGKGVDAGTTGFEFTISAPDGQIEAGNSITITLPDGFADLTEATDQALTGIGTYSISGKQIVITTTSNDNAEAVSGTVTVTPAFDIDGITSDTGTITVESTSYTVTYPRVAALGAPLLGDPPSTTPSTVSVTDTKKDGTSVTGTTIDLVSKTATGSTDFTFELIATAGDLSGITFNNTTIVTFSNHFIVPGTAAIAVTGDLSENLNYKVEGNAIKLQGTGSLDVAKTGTITITGVEFNNDNLPTTADTASPGTGLISCGSTSYDVLLPAKSTTGVTFTVKRVLTSSQTAVPVPVSGVTYEVYAVDSSNHKTGSALTSGATGADGRVRLTVSQAGTYAIVEVESSLPSGRSGWDTIRYGVGDEVNRPTPKTNGQYALLNTAQAISYTPFTFTEYTTPGTVQVQLKNANTNNAINQAGVSYKLAEYTTTPTGNETAVSTSTSNSSGLLTFSVPTPASGTKTYYLTEQTAPSGYRANNTTTTKIFYTFSINTSGTITYTTNASATDKGWSTTVTSGPQTVKYTPEGQEQISVQLKDNVGNINKLGSAFALYTGNTGTATVSGVTLSVSDSGMITSTGLSEVAVETTYYLGETTKPTGYVSKNTTRYAITLTTTGGITYTPATDFAANTSGSGATLTYERMLGQLILNRTAASGGSEPATLTYTICQNADGSGTTYGTIDMTKTGTTYSGSSTANLDWITGGYYVKETTSDYTGKDEAVHGPFKFSATMTDSTAGGTVSTTNMTITATLTPATRRTVTFNYKDTADAAKAGTFTVKDKATLAEQTLTIPAGGSQTMDTLLTGHTYTVTQTSTPSAGCAKLSYDLTVSADGTAVTVADVKCATVTPSGLTVTMKEKKTEIKLRLEICTAERGSDYDRYVDADDEIGYAPGVKFEVAKSSGGSAITLGDGNRYATTDSDGYFTLSGLEDRDYYLKSTTTSLEDYPQIAFDNKTIFKFTVENGALKSGTLAKNSGEGTWNVTNGKIRGYLKTGSVKVTAKSDKTFYLYRLYYGSSSSSEDNRESQKIRGSVPDEIKNASKGDNFVLVADAGFDFGTMIMDGLEWLDSLFVLQAKAAESAKTIEHAGFTWELIGSKKPGSGSSSTFEGLIAGQAYLLREGDSETAGSSDHYYLAKVTTSQKSVAGIASSASTANTANTARTTNGAGTANAGNKGSGAGGARGSATGDAGDLWKHLIIMLFAFDALVADLLYISRKKQRVIRRR